MYLFHLDKKRNFSIKQRLSKVFRHICCSNIVDVEKSGDASRDLPRLNAVNSHMRNPHKPQTQRDSEDVAPSRIHTQDNLQLSSEAGLQVTTAEQQATASSAMPPNITPSNSSQTVSEIAGTSKPATSPSHHHSNTTQHTDEAGAAAAAGSSTYRHKSFHSFDSLRFERERLSTFIGWKVQWLEPRTLCKDGFYYLRDQDHVSCVFCRGIIGAWEPGDIPRQEHGRHFPRCPFVKGQPVGNVPLELGDILTSLPTNGPCVGVKCSPDSENNTCRTICKRPQVATGSEPHNATRSEPVKGLPVYNPPKRKDYLTVEARVKTFTNWPASINQQPRQLAEAGFFHCGLSDHVRCFHCGNGLRNWEAGDDPWVEHARWYPQCSFVIASKGQEYIEEAMELYPPILSSNDNVNHPYTNCGSSVNINPSNSNCSWRCLVTDDQLDRLMELDIARAVVEMGFPVTAVRKTLRDRIETQGVPFFHLETCVEQVLSAVNAMANETEAERLQDEKFNRYREERASAVAAVSTAGAEASASAAGGGADVVGYSRLSSTMRELPTLPRRDSESVINEVLPTLPRRDARPYSNREESVAYRNYSTITSLPPRTLSSQENLDALPPSTSDTRRYFRDTTHDFEFMDIDIIEYPLVSESSLQSGGGDDSMNSESPVFEGAHHRQEESPNITSTPRSSPIPHNHQFMTPLAASSSSAASSSAAASSSSSRDSTRDEQQMIDTETGPSTSSSSEDTAITMEMLNQVNQVISRADREQKRVCRNLSDSSSRSCCSGKSSLNRSIGSDECKNSPGEEVVTAEGCADDAASSSEEESDTNEEKLTKKVLELQSQLERIKESRTCKVCMDADICIVFLPCSHMVTCATCSVALSDCPICRSQIVHLIRPNIG